MLKWRHRNMFKIDKLFVTISIDTLARRNVEFAKFVTDSLDRYTNQDWGEMCEEDIKANDEALKNEDRIFAQYVKGDWKIWIITEWDRSCTTILFPEEY